jgi:flagellin-like protein
MVSPHALPGRALAPTGAGLGAEEDVAPLRTVVRVVTGLLGTMSVAMAAYALMTADRPHRTVLLVAAAAGIGEGLALWRFGARRLLDAARPEALIAVWSAVHIAAVTVLCCLDSGVSSPIGTLLVLLVTFSAVALRPRLTFAIAATGILALTIMILAGPRPESWAGFFVLRVAGLVVIAGVCAAIADDRSRRIDALRESQEELPRRLARVIEFRDRDTGGHVERMSDIAGLIAQELGLGAQAARRLRHASAMHDVGKVAVPDRILLKPGPLTPEERRVMQDHARAGFEMLTGSSSALLELGATIALTHHERYDGGGYPDGLRGEDIPLAGRVTAVADVFDALTSHRVYKEAMPVEAAVAIVVEGRGGHFDPMVVDAFLRVLPDVPSLDRPGPQAVAAAAVR